MTFKQFWDLYVEGQMALRERYPLSWKKPAAREVADAAFNAGFIAGLEAGRREALAELEVRARTWLVPTPPEPEPDPHSEEHKRLTTVAEHPIYTRR